MVACTFISAPLMFISAHMVTITKDYAPQLSAFGFDVSIVATIASLWMIIFFIITKKYNRMPHRVTFCLAVTQVSKIVFFNTKLNSLLQNMFNFVNTG